MEIRKFRLMTDKELRKKIKSTLLIMKLTAFFIMAFCLQLSAKTEGQVVSLSVKNSSLEKVIQSIEKQTGYSFIYSQSLLDESNPVTVTIKKAGIEEALEKIFAEQKISYSVSEKYIVLRGKENIPQSEYRLPIDISGKVTDEDGNPLVGATVRVKETNKVVSTNSDGEFILKDVNENSSIEISFVGYQTAIFKINNSSSIEVSLKPDVKSLNEIVINKGYYRTSRITEVGNVSTITAKDIQNQPVNNPLLAMQGRIPGMIITQVNGLPGSGVKVEIRGQRSIGKGNLPLYVIDGVPYAAENLPNLGGELLGFSANDGSRSGNPLSYINPLDIESIDVLKDADATAIYGSRGANGVVLITTKKGKAGKIKVDVNMQTGWGKVTRTMDLLNTQQYLAMRHEAKRNDNLPVRASDYDLNGTWDSTRYTDWQKELIGGTARYTDVQGSISGGQNNTSFLISANYHKESTVFPGDFNNQRGSVHLNLNSASANQKLTLSLSSLYNTSDSRLPRYDLTSVALTLAPNAPALYNSDGTINWANSTWTNPVAQYLNNKYRDQTNNLINNLVLGYKILKGLEIKSSFGYSSIQTNENALFPSIAKDPAYWPLYGTDLRDAQFSNSRSISWIIEPQATYATNIGKSQLSALIGTTIQQNKSDGQRTHAKGFNSDEMIENPMAASEIKLNGFINSVYKYNALFGRLGYNWNDKYLVNLTGRRDGSSRFGPANRFHNFGALGLGWVFSKENFIADNLSFLSFGKIRGSYGTTGSDQIGDYSFLDLYQPTNVDVPFQGATGLVLTQLFTPDLQWEQTNQVEAAVELGFLKDRINIQVSHYFSTSSNQLVASALPYTAGFTSITKNFDATVHNKGWEISVNTVNINTKNFRWNTNFNISWNRNKLASIDSAMTGRDYNQLVGHPLSSFFVYKYAGVNSATGLYEFTDRNGSPIATPNYLTDRTVLIDQTPKYIAGLQNSIHYKGIQLDFFFHMVRQLGQNQLFFLVPGYWTRDGGNQPVTVLDNHWQKPGDVANIQKFNSNGRVITPYRNALFSDMLFDDLYFVRLKNVSLSWQLPNLSKKTTPFQYLRVFVNGQNLFTKTNYKGLDPETRSTSSLPPLRLLTTGVQVGL